jgi:hypothetical protein
MPIHLRRLAPRFAWALPAIGLSVVSAHADASVSFPGVIKDHWKVAALPVPGDGCRLCHDTDDGLTVTRPFGRTAMLIEGARQKDNDSLRRALDGIARNRWDSDGDAVTDYQEVRFDGTDPNDRRKFVEPPPPPPPSAGGGGNVSGEDGYGEGGSGAGGEGGAAEPSPLPPRPPSFGSLPPPLEHGCSTSPAGGPLGARGSFVATLLFSAALVWHRSRGRRCPA